MILILPQKFVLLKRKISNPFNEVGTKFSSFLSKMHQKCRFAINFRDGKFYGFNLIKTFLGRRVEHKSGRKKSICAPTT